MGLGRIGFSPWVFPCLVEKIVDHGCSDGIAKRCWMYATILFPIKGVCGNSFCNFFSKVDGGDFVILGDGIMGLDGKGCFSILKCFQHSLVNKKSNDDIHVRVGFTGVSDDAFESADAILAGVMCILIIIDCKFDEEQIDGFG